MINKKPIQNFQTRRFGFNYIPVIAIAAVLAMVTPNIVEAAPINISFTGEIQSLTTGGIPGAPSLVGTFGVGDAVSGTLIYDTAAPITISAAGSGTKGQSTTALTSFSLNISGLGYTSTGGLTTTQNDAQNGSLSPFRDAIFFQASSGVAGPTVGGLSADLLQFSLGTTILTTLANANLPTASLINALFGNNGFDGNTNFIRYTSSELARFSISSLNATSVSVVPLPAALPLYGTGLAIMGFIGLAIMGFIGWRRKQKSTA